MEITPRHLVTFQTTNLSEVGRAHQENPEGARPVLGQLLGRYISPLVSHLIVRRRYEPAVAEDVVQQFVADQILANKLLSDYDHNRGKFRTFLLTCLDRFSLNFARREQTAGRSPGRDKLGPLPEDEQLLPLTADDPTATFDRAWAQSVLNESLKRTEEFCRAAGHDLAWMIFNARVVRPALEGTQPPAYSELGSACNLISPTQAANALVTAKRAFQRVLREVLGEFGSRGTDLEQDVHELLDIFAGVAKQSQRR